MTRKVNAYSRQELEQALKRSSDTFWDRLAVIANRALDKYGSTLSLDGLSLQGFNLIGDSHDARKNFGQFSVTRSRTDEDGTVHYYQVTCQYSLKKANFDSSSLKNILFTQCNLASSSFFCATLVNVSFNNLDLRNANFSGATLIGCRFNNCKLNNTSFENATFASNEVCNSSFQSCDFGNNNFSGADITEVDGLSELFSKKLLTSSRPQLLGIRLPNSILESVKTDAQSIIDNWNRIAPKVAREKTKEKYMMLLAAYTKLATNHFSLTPKDLHMVAHFKSSSIQLAKFKSNYLLALKQMNRQFIYLITLQRIFTSITMDTTPMDIIRIIFHFTNNSLPAKPFINKKMIEAWNHDHPAEAEILEADNSI